MTGTPVRIVSAEDPAACRELLAALGDASETVLAHHLLTRGWGRAFVVGDPSQPRAAIVDSTLGPDKWPAGEPTGFGSDPASLWSALRVMEGWDCVLVDRACAEPLGALIQSETGRPVRYFGEVWLALHRPAARFSHPDVRPLTPDDTPLLENASVPQLRGEAWPTPHHLLTDGIAAGAIVDGQLVAIASTCARSATHAEIQIYTLEPYRRRGLSRAAASLAAQLIQAAGQTPAWGAAHDNDASLHIARTLGFTEVTRRTFVIPERPADPRAE